TKPAPPYFLPTGHAPLRRKNLSPLKSDLQEQPMKQRRSILPLCAGILLMIGGADWRQFRGPHSSGVAPEESGIFNPAGNVACKIDLPGRGLSCPMLGGDRVFLRASRGGKKDRRHIMAFADSTGKTLGERAFGAPSAT